MKNPLLSSVQDFYSQKVHAAFPELGFHNVHSALVFQKYLASRPEKFFSRDAFDTFLAALRDLESAGRDELLAYIQEHGVTLDNAFRHAQEINALGWHDSAVKGENDYLTLMLIDREVHPAYLRLVEAVFYPMLKIIAYFSRLASNKGVEKLDLYQVVEELQDDRFIAVKAPYTHVMRNAIAHGGIRYSADRIIYDDRRGSELALTPREVLRKFDDALDVCNGLLFAYSIFVFSLREGENLVPRNLMIEELRAETGTPYWHVSGALPSKILGGRSQLILYCSVRTSDGSKVKFSAIQTAIQAERAAPGYDRYFLSMRPQSGVTGWAAFSGSKLNYHRLEQHGIEEYGDVVEDYLPLFLKTNYRPSIWRRLGTLRYALQTGWPIMRQSYLKRVGRPSIVVRAATVHRSIWVAVLNADVVIQADGREIDQETVRNYSRKAVSLAARQARRQLSWFNLNRYLPLGFAQIDVFCTDYRRRRLSSFGLAKELVGTIRLQRVRRINPPDILGSVVESFGGYKFAWNRSWLER
jgi:hypothetical protein